MGSKLTMIFLLDYLHYSDYHIFKQHYCSLIILLSHVHDSKASLDFIIAMIIYTLGKVILLYTNHLSIQHEEYVYKVSGESFGLV
jgi:hypothetical protein